MKELLTTSIVSIGILLLLASTVFAVDDARVGASLLRYEPTPAEQGAPVDVWVQLTNTGTQADSVIVKFIPEYPFSLPEGSRGTYDLGTIAAIESKVQKFSVFVDPSAANGDRTIKFEYKFQSANTWTRLEAPISLLTQNPTLVIDAYTTNPGQIVPGQTADLELHLRNAGRSSVKNVDVSIDLTNGKFSTLDSGAKKRIDSIAGGETQLVRFKLASDTSTSINVYSTPVSLSYQDERNKQYNETAKISLVVNAKPELSLTTEATKFADKNQPGTVSVKVVNKGVVNVKYVTVDLLPSADYAILSTSSQLYIGNLDSDDFQTVDYTIKPTSALPRLNLSLHFKDPYNTDFSQQYAVPARILTDGDLGKTSWPTSAIIITVLVLGAIVYAIARYRKKRA